MKKSIIISGLFFLIIFNISCLKNSSTTSSGVVSTTREGKQEIYYYTLCNNSVICKFTCETDNVLNLTYKNIANMCKKPILCFPTKREGVLGAQHMQEIKIAAKSPTVFEIIDLDDKKLERFDHLIKDRAEGFVPDENYPCSEPTPTESEPWMRTKDSSGEIYQKLPDDSELAGLQWSQILGKMTYQKAKETCENYKFRNYSGWRLPSNIELQEAAIDELGELPDIQYQDLIWSSDETNDQVDALPLFGEGNVPQKTNKDSQLNTICVRNHN